MRLSAVKIRKVTIAVSRLRNTITFRNLSLFCKLCRILTKAQSTSFKTAVSTWVGGGLVSGTNPEATEKIDPSYNTKKCFCLPNSARSEIIHVAGSVLRLITRSHHYMPVVRRSTAKNATRPLLRYTAPASCVEISTEECQKIYKVYITYYDRSQH